jgi:hypothetical protein
MNTQHLLVTLDIRFAHNLSMALGEGRKVRRAGSQNPTQLHDELERDQTKLDDMLANPPGPFDHAGALEAKTELSALTLELRGRTTYANARPQTRLEPAAQTNPRRVHVSY